jgi:hypothetical protein
MARICITSPVTVQDTWWKQSWVNASIGSP